MSLKSSRESAVFKEVGLILDCRAKLLPLQISWEEIVKQQLLTLLLVNITTL